MTLTLDFNNSLIRQVQAAAAAKGVSTEQFIESAVRASLRVAEPAVGAEVSAESVPGAQPWLYLIGSAREYASELAELDAAIETAFEQIEDDDLP